MKIYKKLYSIKYENILLALFIPLAMIQFIQAREDFRLLSILASLTLYGGLALAIRVGRKEALEEIRLNTYEPLIDIEEILTNANIILNNISKVLKSIKKKKLSKCKIYKRPSLYIKKCKYKITS